MIYISRMMRLLLQFIICVFLSIVFLFLAVCETEAINNRLIQIHHEFRFRSNTVVFLTQDAQDETKYVYMPRCADLRRIEFSAWDAGATQAYKPPQDLQTKRDNITRELAQALSAARA
jgi:hypothetical protein